MCLSCRNSAFDFSGRRVLSDPRGFDFREGGFMEKGGFLFNRSACKGNMLILGKGSRSDTAAEDSSRRSFLCFSEDYFDDEYYDELVPEKKRRLTSDQVDLLEKTFEVENKLEPERKTELAKKLGVEPRQVAVWFQNRRAQWKNKQLKRDYDYLKSSYDSLLSNYDAVMKENEKLKSEVVSLTEKLQGNEPLSMEQLPAEEDHLSAVGIGLMVEDRMTSRTNQLLAKEKDHIPAVDIGLMVEDRMSSRTGGSAVVNEETIQLVDSGNSYLLCGDFSGCVGTVQGNMFGPGEPVADEEEPLSWWVWPEGLE